MEQGTWMSADILLFVGQARRPKLYAREYVGERKICMVSMSYRVFSSIQLGRVYFVKEIEKSGTLPFVVRFGIRHSAFGIRRNVHLRANTPDNRSFRCRLLLLFLAFECFFTHQ